MIGLDFAFWILAIVGVVAALLVVTLRNVFRAALSLVVCFLTVAGIYVTLSADFLAAVQVLVYVGAISVLIILAIMMTRRVPGGSPANEPAIVVLVSIRKPNKRLHKGYTGGAVAAPAAKEIIEQTMNYLKI